MKKTISILIIVLAVFSNSAFAQEGKPKVIKYVALKYPAAAKAIRASGTVDVNVKISKEGKVVLAEAVSGHQLLRKTAENASKEWLFSSDSTTEERQVKITFLLRIGDKNKRDKVKFKKPYTLEVVAGRVRIYQDKHPGY